MPRFNVTYAVSFDNGDRKTVHAVIQARSMDEAHDKASNRAPTYAEPYGIEIEVRS